MLAQVDLMERNHLGSIHGSRGEVGWGGNVRGLLQGWQGVALTSSSACRL